MTRRPSARALALATLLTAPSLLGAQEGAMDPAAHHGPASSEEAVRSAVESFHRALGAADSVAALRMLEPDATVYESGHPETRSEYRSGHLRADVAFSAAVSREVVADEVVLHGPVAVYTSVTRRRGTFRDREVDSTGTETIVLRLDGEGRWRIRHIHWSSR